MRLGSLLLVIAATQGGCKARVDGGDASEARGAQSNGDGCQIEDMSGRGRSSAEIAAADDPIAKLVLSTPGGCPTTFKALMDKLRQTDAVGCIGGTGGQSGPIFLPPPPGSGVKVALVSERAAVTGKPEGYRPVITRLCAQRGAQDLMFAPLGVSLNGPLPSDVEVVAFDSTRSVYDFYAFEGGKIRFFGDSADFLQGAGAGADFQNTQRRCAQCHVSGGLIMKEQIEPWANWLGTLRPPQADDLIQKLGKDLELESITPLLAVGLENAVQAGNTRVMDAKAKRLRDAGDWRLLLRQLFCSQDFNLFTRGHFIMEAGGLPESAHKGIDLAPDLLINGGLGTGFGVIGIDGATYDAAIAATRQHMLDDDDTPFKGADGKALVDTVIPFIYPGTAIIDSEYATALVKQNILSSDFVAAVLGTDLTRPVFSAARCSLLDLTAGMTLTPQSTAKDVSDAFVKALNAKPARTAAEAEFLGFLKRPVDQKQRARTFAETCRARGASDQAGLAKDVLAMVGLRRNAARTHPIVEHQTLLPLDDQQVAAEAHLDPKTCKLVNR
jgi:hypothetical protein